MTISIQPPARDARSTSPGASSSGRWLRELTLVALHPDGPGTLADLTRVLGLATGAHGAVLWEDRTAAGPARLSLLSRWLEGHVAPARSSRVAADSLSDHALRCRSLAIPADLAEDQPSLFGLPVTAAMPVDYLDGCRGVLTLLGPGELSDEAFDVAAELVGILPELCHTLRERQTLALINGCNTILHDADVESPDQPLPRGRLREHLGDVCALVAQVLPCTEVSIFLQEELTTEGRYPLFARDTPRDGGHPTPQPGAVLDARSNGLHRQPRVGQEDPPLLDVPLRSGPQVWGWIRCRGTQGPPFHFTSSDLSLLNPVAALLARYWRNWLQRRTICAENKSWRQLAAGFTSFNSLLAEGCRGSAAQDLRRERRVAEAALLMVSDVVRDATGASVSRAVIATASAPRLVPVASIGDADRSPPDLSALTDEVLRTRHQRGTTDPAELAGAGAGAGTGWLLCTPIRVDAQVYGVLHTRGPSSELPANAAQVYQIVADQLGLYLHLRQALGHLEEARRSLQDNLRSQAEVMEDLKHQLVSPLRTATDRTELVIRGGRVDTRVETQLKAVRGLCRKASRVAMSAGVFAALSKGGLPAPKLELLGVDDLLRMLIAAADDAQVLSNPRLGITFDVDRASVRQLGRRLVDVDASFLQQCIGNLLDNAAKYSYPGTQVHVGGTRTGDELVLEVTNTGLRLDPADVTRCLQRNWRGESARNATGEGSGIGLWIVDHLVRSMQGRVDVDVAADTTTVRLHLPLAGAVRHQT